MSLCPTSQRVQRTIEHHRAKKRALAHKKAAEEQERQEVIAEANRKVRPAALLHPVPALSPPTACSGLRRKRSGSGHWSGSWRPPRASSRRWRSSAARRRRRCGGGTARWSCSESSGLQRPRSAWHACWLCGSRVAMTCTPPLLWHRRQRRARAEELQRTREERERQAREVKQKRERSLAIRAERERLRMQVRVQSHGHGSGGN